MTTAESIRQQTEEYVWISKAINIDIFTSHAHPILRRLAQELDVKVTIAGSEGLDLQDEPFIKAIYDAIDRKVAGILIHGWGVPAEVEAINTAIENGIPVITLDSDVPTSKRLAHVGTDWFRMGAAMADQLAGLVGNSGKVLYMGNDSLANLQAGFRGFQSCMNNYPDIELLHPHDGSTIGSDESIATDWLTRYPDIKGIAGFESHSGPGVARALEKMGLAGKVKLVCVDAETAHIEHINKGTIQVAFAQRRESFTYQAFQMLYAYNHGAASTGYQAGLVNIGGNIDTGFIIVTKWNIDSFQHEFNLDETIDRLKLSRRVALMSTVIESSGQMTLAVDSERRIVYANPATVHMSGLSATEIIGVPLNQIFDFNQQNVATIEHCAATGASAKFESSVRCNQAACLPVQLTVSPLKNNIIQNGLAIIAADISELKRAQAVIRENEERLNQAIRTANIGIFDHNHITDELYWSPEQRQVFKWGADDLVSLDLLAKQLHPDDHGRIVEALRRAHDPEGDGVFDVEYRIFDRAGEIHWTRNRSRTIFEGEGADRHPVRSVGALLDITEQKQIEDTLLKKYEDEKQFQTLLKALHEVSVELTAINGLDAFYRSVVELGLSRLDLDRVGLYTYDAERNVAIGTYGTDDKGNVQDEHHLRVVLVSPGGMWKSMNSPDRFFYEEQGPVFHNNLIVGSGSRVAITLRDGNRVLGWLVADNYLRHRPLTIQYREVLAQYGMNIAAILVRKQVEIQKQESEQILQTILDTIPTRVFWKDKQSRMIGCNQRFIEDSGVASAADLIGKNDHDLSPEVGKPWEQQAARYIADDQLVISTGASLVGYEETQTRADGKTYWLRTTKLPLKNTHGEIVGVLGAYEDITERKLSELALEAKRQEEQQFQQYLKILHEISRELTKAENLNEFYQKTIKLGLERLGFDRMGLWLYDAVQNMAIGTYGTDTNGNLQSESQLRFTLEQRGGMWGALQNPNRFYYEEVAPLVHNLKPIGTGWNVTIALWDGNRNLGWLSIDNFIHNRPISQPQLEILAQYGMLIAATLSRKQTEAALIVSEERLRQAISVGKIGIIDDHLDGTLYVSSEERSFYGWSPDETITREMMLQQIHPDDVARMSEAANRSLDPTGDGLLSEVEFRILDTQGVQHWLSLRTQTIFEGESSERHPVRVIGAVMDITNRKQAEEALMVSEERLRQAARAGNIGVFDTDEQSDTGYFSPEHRAIYGWDADEVLTLDKLLNQVHPDDRERLLASLKRSRDPAGDGILLDVEYRITDLNGIEHWLSTRSRTFFEGEGSSRHPVRSVGAISDITYHKQTEEALRLSETRFRSLVENSPDFISFLDQDFRIQYINRLAEGSSSDRILGAKPTDFIMPQYVESVLATFKQVLETGKSGQYTVQAYSASGAIIWLHARVVPVFEDGKPTNLMLVTSDITERRRIEDALQVSEERLRQAVRTGNIGIFDHDHINDTIYWSLEQQHIYGWPPDEVVTVAGIGNRIHPEDFARIADAWDKSHDPQGDGNFDLESRIINRDGTPRWVNVRSQTLFAGDGKERRHVRTIGATTDITAYKQQQEALVRYNQRLSILRDIDRAILSSRSTLEIISSVLEQVSQLIPCEWISMVLYDENITQEHIYAWRPNADIRVDVLHPQPVVENDVLAQLKTGRSTLTSDLRPMQGQQAKLADALLDQGMRGAMANPLVIFGKLMGVLAFASKQVGFFTAEHREIAEAIADQVAIALHQAELNEKVSQQNMELEQRVAERTQELQEANEEIKNFAYIVSHDLRAPLVNLKGFAAELLDSLKIVKSGCDDVLPLIAPAKRDPILQALQLDIPEAIHYIESSVSNMDTFTKAILKLSRLGRLQLEIVNIDSRTIVEKRLESLGYQISQKNIKVIVGALPTIAADLVSMEQIFGNILANAIAYLIPDRPGEIEISAWSNAHETIFRVRDNGRGIAKEDMDKVFAPFRRAGKQDVPGEGMGLAYVQTLVRRHGGRIWCESQPNLGTTFCFTISNHLLKDNQN